MWRGATFWTNQRLLSDTKTKIIILTPTKRRFWYSIFVLAIPHSKRSCEEVRHATKDAQTSLTERLVSDQSIGVDLEFFRQVRLRTFIDPLFKLINAGTR